jgi:7-carboxy-7-deazaguanine synthase
MFQNSQKPEPKADIGTGMIDIHSMFFTIQGEGPYSGHSAIFIRLAGCNLQCPGCDTEYTQGRVTMPLTEVYNQFRDMVEEYNCPNVLAVITGGEPLRQDIDALVSILLLNHHPVQIESNGVFEVSPVLRQFIQAKKLMLVISPKTSRINPVTAEWASVYKYVLHADYIADDGLPTQALYHPTGRANKVARPPQGWRGPIYINPFDNQDPEQNRRHLNAVAIATMAYGYVAGVQLHKIIGLD